MPTPGSEQHGTGCKPCLWFWKPQGPKSLRTGWERGGRGEIWWTGISLPEFMNFELFGKTILVVNINFELFLVHPLSK